MDILSKRVKIYAKVGYMNDITIDFIPTRLVWLGSWGSSRRGLNLFAWRIKNSMAKIGVELVVACILSGAVAEKLLPINSFLVCASVALFIGGATGVVLDLWQKVAPSFAMNIFNKFSKMFTGAELPKDAIEKSEKKDFKDDK